MADHLKNFATGLVLSALFLLAVAGVVAYWKAALLAFSTVCLLLAIYMAGYSWRKQKESRNVR
jgi:small-conductance mechanosensitive channel